MSESDRVELATLIAHIEKHLTLLETSISEISAAEDEDLPKLGRTSRSAVLVAGLIENYYTCAETVFVRISQYFENSLPAERWHTELLSRMTLKIEPFRPQVLSDETHRDLEDDTADR